MTRRPDNLRRAKKNSAEPVRPNGDAKKDSNARGTSRPWYSGESIRETVESLAIALIFAFLLRTFVVEAFVIPTGSMATTLLGRHKDVVCPKCGYPFQINAGQELDKSGSATGTEVIAGTCPMCRFTLDVGHGHTSGKDYPSYAGDRIMADRSGYAFKRPDRWDVTVFQCPRFADENYIKRLVGLPNETVRIEHGDIWVRPQGANTFSIARKPPEKVLATMRPVYDNDYVLPELVRQGWPARWTSLTTEGWKASEDLKSFRTEGTAAQDVWLGYRHVPLSHADWAYLSGVTSARRPAPKPQLVSDFLGYDTEQLWPPPNRPMETSFVPPRPSPLPGDLGPPPRPESLGMNWVGDLIVEFSVQANAAKGELLIELVKGGKPFVCRLDLEKGSAALAIPGAAATPISKASGLRGPGLHAVRLANVDQQLILWVDGRVVGFDAPATYDSAQVDTSEPNQEDLTPVRIGSRGAAVEVSHLKLFRDIYYVAVQTHNAKEWSPLMTDFRASDADFPFSELSAEQARRFFTDPTQWDIFRRRRSVEFPLQDDQYFMLGDNSTESWDGRLWGDADHFVSGDLLVGRAVFVYWPHSWNRIPGTGIPFPFFPNFARMGRIR